jgi:predicted metal-binding protein
MKPVWHQNLVIVCEKCGKKLAKGPDTPNPSHELKDWLKKQFLAKEMWGVNRVVTSSCLDICPEGKVAVAFTSDRPDLETWAEVIDPVGERDRILHIASERAKPAPK